jgi:hypothetical protein
VTPDKGGTLSLVDGAGVKYTFEVAPGNVLEPVAVTMRLVASFSSFPAQAAPSAVVFEPDGFVFEGAGLLTIAFPAAPAAADVTSFSFAGDGSSFRLVPSLVVGKEVRIPVTHFSGHGTDTWQPAERSAVLAQKLNDARVKMEQQAADQLRQGMPVADLFQSYFHTYLEPLMAEAAHDCATSRALLPQLLGLARQQAILVTDSATFASNADIQAWTCNCLKEAKDSCKAGRINAQALLRTWLAMEQQSQVLGIGDVGTLCGFGSSEEVFTNGTATLCASEWTGTISYSASGKTTTTIGTTTHTSSYSQSFGGDIVDGMLAEGGTTTDNGGGVLSHERWRLVFGGSTSATFQETTTDMSAGTCGTVVHTVTGAGGGNAAVKVGVDFTFDGDTLKTFNIGTVTNADGLSASRLSFKAVGSNTFRIPGCNGAAEMVITDPATTDFDVSPLSPSAFKALVFTRKSPQVIEGNMTETRAGAGPDGIDTTLSWKFSLHRRGS